MCAYSEDLHMRALSTKEPYAYPWVEGVHGTGYRGIHGALGIGFTAMASTKEPYAYPCTLYIRERALHIRKRALHIR